MKNSGSENRCTILSALAEKIVPYNVHFSVCLSIVYYAILTQTRGRGLRRGQVNINVLELFLLLVCNLQRNIYASAATVSTATAGSALRASPMELLAQAAQQQENPCATFIYGLAH